MRSRRDREQNDRSSQYVFLAFALIVYFWSTTSNEIPETPPGETSSVELKSLEDKIRALEYEKVARSRAVADAQQLLDAASKQRQHAQEQPQQPQIIAARSSGASIVSQSSSNSENGGAIQQVRDRCAVWAYEYGVVPGQGWGSLPDELKRDWMTLSCHDHLPPHTSQGLPHLEAPVSASPQAPPPSEISSGLNSGAESVKNEPSMRLPNLRPREPQQQQQQREQPKVEEPEEPGPLALEPIPSGVEYIGYTFWSSDFHISPIADLKDLFRPLGMKIIDKSLSGHCHLKKTCAKDLRVLTKGNGISLGKCPNQLRRDFFKSYVNDQTMRGVDAFLCHHACGLCEAFMPFNKSLVVVASTRFEIGRHEPQRWKLWVENLRTIAKHPRNVVAANNRYDAEYVKYFTGLKNVLVLPNFCAYTKVEYGTPTKREVLIGPGRGINDQLYRELMSASRGAANRGGFSFARIRDLYPHFEYSDLVKHKAIVLIPYQVSIMSIFEYYRMAIPLFVPSTDLLAKWQLKHRVMDERTWSGVFKKFAKKSSIPQHPASDAPPLDPNNEFDHAAIKHWIAFADFYQWPHITQFENWDDLMQKLAAADLAATSKKMKAFNARTKRELVDTWKELFHRMFHGLPPAASSPREQLRDFDDAMRAKYGGGVARGCVGDSHAARVPQNS